MLCNTIASFVACFADSKWEPFSSIKFHFTAKNSPYTVYSLGTPALGPGRRILWYMCRKTQSYFLTTVAYEDLSEVSTGFLHGEV